MAHFFNAIIDGNNISRSKPDPEVFLKAAEYLELAPPDCAVVEDAWAGIEAAKAGGHDRRCHWHGCDFSSGRYLAGKLFGFAEAF